MNELITTAEVMAMERNPLATFLSSQSPTSRYGYRLDLRDVAIILGYGDPFTLPWGELRFQHTQAIRSIMTETISSKTGKGLSISTINKKLSALRGVLKTAWRLSLMSAEDYHRAVDIENVKGTVLPFGRELSKGEVQGLMDACARDLTPAGTRDAALISLMYMTGLRRNEVIMLDMADYDQNTGMLKVQGKRRKERTAYLVNEASIAMEDWSKVRGDMAGPIFLPFNGKTLSKVINRHLTGETIYYILVKRGKQAGISDKFSPYDMRRTFVSDLLDAGVDIATVSKMAGHASIITTALYDRRPEEIKRDAAAKLHISYQRRTLT